MSYPFDGCWHRFDRAKAHRDEAIGHWNAFLDNDPYDARLDVDDEGNCTLWLEQLEAVPPLLAVCFGEYVYNLRAALDYCAYAVAVCDTKRNPPPGEDSLQFPIYSKEDSYVRNEYRIKPLSEKHREWLKSVQPYFGNYGPKGTALYWLNNLARRDRHRQLEVVGAYISESTPLVSSSRGPVSVFFEDVEPYIFVERNAVIARFKVFPHLPHDQIEANPNTILDVEIMEMVRERPEEARWLFYPLPMRLIVLEMFVDAIIGRFERDCTGGTRSKAVADEPEVDGPAL
jgi:hypothetical protein